MYLLTLEALCYLPVAMVGIAMLRQEALCYRLVASMGLAPVGPEAAGKTAPAGRSHKSRNSGSLWKLEKVT